MSDETRMTESEAATEEQSADEDANRRGKRAAGRC